MFFLKKGIRLILSAILLLGVALPAYATVEAEKLDAFTVSSDVLDTTLSGDGKFFFVLSAKGVIEIYPTSGGAKEVVSIEGKADKIVSSENGERLFLTDSKSGKTQLVSISFIKSINIAGSPFKGPENAPVAMVIFSDFQ